MLFERGGRESAWVQWVQCTRHCRNCRHWRALRRAYRAVGLWNRRRDRCFGVVTPFIRVPDGCGPIAATRPPWLTELTGTKLAKDAPHMPDAISALLTTSFAQHASSVCVCIGSYLISRRHFLGNVQSARRGQRCLLPSNQTTEEPLAP